MKMQEEKICPYPGLRPFNEEESIFFRGREEHIDKIISQLEEKKFVMLTGASGDGKSSLVYAGVIPNARAGFFKAKFNNWLIADFRPERTPLKNLAVALAAKLNFDAQEVEKELNFGFSSLVNLYKKSFYHLDYTSTEYKSAEESEKKKLKRKAANLFILVDQFEEFFTNPENYKNGQASNESQLVANLLLETARIALAEDLPIYIVCTMRSDYIGQCAAFRGLPEYIGYSQFFVPRLKRKEIHQVINEPALLSGNTISNRLVETLINEIGDGFDQLPVLQHALNRVWHKTNKGEYEMDLLHLAMVGGLPPSQLPENDRIIFEGWLGKVSENKKMFFNKASLDAVLNAHAHELYETAYEYYNEHHTEKIEKTEAQLIIKTAFQCFTKIDESRAVRNRMSLQEITNIIHDENVPVEKVDGVLTIFRLQGNTFLKPFSSTEQPETLTLKPETVLDITHESLIRNWQLLEQWAKEEHENWLTFQDFNKQLQRWLANDRAKGFLLPIGPLSFFETWYNTCNPNKYWLARYDESSVSQQEKLLKAESTLRASNEFIKASARNLFFSRTVLKYGAGKLIAGAGVLLLICACTYYYFDFQKKQNENVIDNITSKGINLLHLADVGNYYKGDFLINRERLIETNQIKSNRDFEDLLNKLENDSMAFDIAYSMLNQCRTIHQHDSLPYDRQGVLSMKIFTYLFHRFENDADTQIVSLNKNKNADIKLKRINDFLGLCALMKNSYQQRDSAAIESICSKAIWLSKNLLSNSLKRLQYKKADIRIPELNYCISLLLSIDDKPDYSEIINYFETEQDSAQKGLSWIYYKSDAYSLSCNNIGNGFNEIKAMLYTTVYDKDTSVLSKIRRLVNLNSKRIIGYYSTNIYFSLLKNSKIPLLKTDDLINYPGLSKSRFIKRLALGTANTLDFSGENGSKDKFLANYFYTDERKEEIWSYYFSSIVGDPKFAELSLSQLIKQNYSSLTDSLKAEIVNYFKYRGAYCYYYKKNPGEGELCIQKMTEIYNSISLNFRNKDDIYFNRFFSLSVEHFKSLLCPHLLVMTALPDMDCDNSWSYDANYTYPFFKLGLSSQYLHFILKKNKLYESDEFEQSVLFYLEYINAKNWELYSDIILKHEKNNKWNITNTIENNVSYSDTSVNIYSTVACPLMEIILALKKNDTTESLTILRKSIAYLNPHNIKSDFIERLKKEAAMQLALHSCTKESILILDLMKDDAERRNTLLEICNTLQTEGPIENTFIYLDKLFDGLTQDTKSGLGLFRVMGKIGGREITDLTQKQLRKTYEGIKPRALKNLIIGVAERGNYYEALQYLPEYISQTKELNLYNEIIKAEIIKRENKNAKNSYKGNWNDAGYFRLDMAPPKGVGFVFDLN